jgi:tyrosinase
MGVGGATPPVGLMSRFETAAQDPIFWLHHANIDRLWEAWLLRRPTNRNPSDSDWLTARFTLGSGTTTTTLLASQIVDTRQPPLGYRYSDMPVVPTPEALGERPDEVPEFIGEEPRPPELVGATDQPVQLGSTPTTATVAINSPRGPIAREFEGEQLPPSTRVYLKLENVTATRLNASTVVVYINIPPGGRPSDHPDRRVGNLPVFGVVEASRRTDTHSGSGISATYEITKAVRALTAAGSWDPSKVQVTFVPIADATGAIGQGDVKVGRVSLFYA